MDTNKLLTADYLDIVFDKRNKTYGGYELRRHYNRRMGRAFGSLLLGMSALVFLSFVSARKAAPSPDVIFDRTTTITNIHPPAIELPKVRPALPPPAAPKPPKTLIWTPPVITDDPIPEDKQLAHTADLNHATAGRSSGGTDSLGTDIGPATTGKPGTGIIVTEPEHKGPFIVVEQMPQFPGDLNAYIGRHLTYPEQARANGIEGRVVIEFVVNEDGKVSNTRIVRSIGGGCDEEALKMVASMPAWKPGKHNGIPVKVFFTLPVKFELK